MQTLPLTRDLVLIGGGHAHALVLLDWAMNPLPGARVTLIDPNPSAPYTGMLPGHIAGHYPRDALEIDLVRLARHAGARLVTGRAEGLDPASGTIRVNGRPPIRFDVVSIDIGITSDMPDLPGFPDHGVGAKPLGAYAARWERFLAEVKAGARRPDIAVLGGGVAGIELALAMDHRLRDTAERRITIIERDPLPLAQMGPNAHRALQAELARRRITLRAGLSAQGIERDRVTLSDGSVVPAALVVGAAGSRPHDWLAATGLPLTDGFITVDPFLRAQGHGHIFATGDCAHLAHAPRPKAGVFAVREAPVLAHNLRAALSGGALRRFDPQRDYLKLISLGERSALAEKWGLALSGRWLWRLKDRIDRKFMRMFHDLPAMPPPALPRRAALGMAEALGDKPLCGGCGAKMGPGPLRAALATLPAPDAAALRLGVGDDAAVLQMGPHLQVIATDHLRSVTEDPYLMARIAATHALGDIWAMGAAPQIALASLTLPRLSETLQERTLAEIMAGAASVFGAAGATIAGGHTAIGAELSIGFTVTGLADDRILTKGGALPGQRLILTKPLGSGTLLAAEMDKQAQGRDIAALWPYLTQSQQAASALLTPVAGAMTDITGFGLAGHLDEILRASGLRAILDLGRLPVFNGAEALAGQGIASSLAPSNRAALTGRLRTPDGPRARLLIDPQTAGGLLATVPADQADRLVAQLVEAGYAAACIGRLEPETGDTPAITAH
ncbi:MAG: selenide, water dikinase [Rhodobacteraceae bacterium HLUCCA12]|nr:MAG: selenide, water dikinase [Rhodobacteraceae bacterium HLUCCA12]